MVNTTSGVTLISRGFIRRLNLVWSIFNAVLCLLALAIDILLSRKRIDSFAAFFNKIYTSDPFRDTLVCGLSSNTNERQLTMPPISLYQFNGQLTHVKPARRFYLLIFPMHLYIMFLIFRTKMFNEEEALRNTINLTTTDAKQDDFYKCNNDTDICVSYVFKRENVIDTITSLVSWWTGLTFLLNKIVFILHKGLKKMYLRRKRWIPLQYQIIINRVICFLGVIVFKLVIIIDVINPTYYDKLWQPFILSGLLILCIISRGASEFIEIWKNLNLDEQRQVIDEAHLNETRPVLIMETVQPKSALKTLIRQMEPTISMFVQYKGEVIY